MCIELYRVYKMVGNLNQVTHYRIIQRSHMTLCFVPVFGN